MIKSIDKKGHILSSFQLIKTFDINSPIEIFEVASPLWRPSSMHSFLYFDNHHFVHRSVNCVQASCRQIQSNQNSCPLTVWHALADFHVPFVTCSFRFYNLHLFLLHSLLYKVHSLLSLSLYI